MSESRKSKIIKVFPRHGALDVCVRVGGAAHWDSPAVWIDLEKRSGYFSVEGACDLLGRIAQAVTYAREVELCIRNGSAPDSPKGWQYYEQAPDLSGDALVEHPGTNSYFESADLPEYLPGKAGRS